MKIRFIQHNDWIGPGEYLAWAERHNFETAFTRCWRNEKVPTEPDSDLLVILGGWERPSTTKEESGYYDAKAERELIRKYVETGKMTVGVCLGAQLIGEALGAPFSESPEREVGYVTARLTDAGKADTLFSAFPSSFPAGEWHDDMPGVTADSAVIAESDGCPRQIVRYAPLVYGFQAHMEFNPEIVAEGLIKDSERVKKGGRFVRTPEEMLSLDWSEMNGLLSSFLDALVKRYANTPASLSRDEKKRELFRKQKKTLDVFLEHGAISRAQYVKSLSDMKEKMGID